MYPPYWVSSKEGTFHFLASLLGIAFSALMMALGRRKWRDPLPFAPFLCTAAFFLFVRPDVARLYFQLFLF